MSKPTALVPVKPGALRPAGPEDRFREALQRVWDRLESEHSRRAYRSDWETFSRWIREQGRTELEADPWTIEQYVVYMGQAGYAKKTRARALSTLRAVYGAMVVAGLMAINPAREVKNLKVSNEPSTPWLDEATLSAFVAATRDDSWIETRDRAIVLVLLGVALRRAEVARLRWEDLTARPDGSLVLHTIVKGKQPKLFAVPSYTTEALAVWQQRSGGHTTGPVFVAHPRSREAVVPETVYNVVKRIAERAGIDPKKVTAHAFRRTAATLVSERGASLAELQQMLGHKNQATSEIYKKTTHVPTTAPGELLADLIKRRS